MWPGSEGGYLTLFSLLPLSRWVFDADRLIGVSEWEEKRGGMESDHCIILGGALCSCLGGVVITLLDVGVCRMRVSEWVGEEVGLCE